MIYENMAWKKVICFTNLKILETDFRGQKGPHWTGMTELLMGSLMMHFDPAEGKVIAT